MRPPATPSRIAAVFALIALASLAAICVALVSQHVFDMQPCPWCVLQRVILLAIATVAVVGWGRPAGAVAIGAGLTGFVLAGCGIAAALWQHFQAAASASCNLTLADRIISGIGLDRAWPNVFEPRASCADAAVSLFGVPYDFWSLGFFILVGAASAWQLRHRAGR